MSKRKSGFDQAMRDGLYTLWELWLSHYGDNAKSCRTFANLLLSEAAEIAGTAEGMDEEDGKREPVDANAARVVELRAIVRDLDADVVKSGLMKYMLGQQDTFYCHDYAVMWAMELRPPTKREAKELEKFNNGEEYHL